jgi:hypothetical protein
MLDWERSDGLPIPSVAQVEEWLMKAWVHWPGRIAVYGAEWVTGFIEWRNRNPEFPLWYANYNLTDPVNGGAAECARWNADIWQWSSSQPVPGVNDPTCDMNHVFNWDTLVTISEKEIQKPMTRTYQWSYGEERCTLEQLETKWSWKNTHPEMRRRAIACANAAQDAGFDLGFGEGARNPVQQLAEFFRRHIEVPSGGCCKWNGKRYKLKAGMAPISPPGYSNHDDEIYEGCSVAIDFVGWENHWFDANCERFGIKNFGGLIGPGVNGEEWHGQPLELPNSRKDVTAYFANGGKLKFWPLPSDSLTPIPPTPIVPPQPPQLSKEIDMLILDLNPNTAWWVAILLAGDEATHLKNGHHVAVMQRGGVPRVPLGSPDASGEVEMQGILTSVITTNDSPFAPGTPSHNDVLHAAWLAARPKTGETP